MRAALALFILVACAPSAAALDPFEGDLDLAIDPTGIAPAPSGGPAPLVVEARVSWRIDPTGCSRVDARIQDVAIGSTCPAPPALDAPTVASEGEAEVTVAPAGGGAAVEADARVEVTIADASTQAPVAPARGAAPLSGPARAGEAAGVASAPGDASRVRPEPRAWTQEPGATHAAPPPAPPAPTEPAPSAAPDLHVASWAPILPLPPLAPDAPAATLAVAGAATLAVAAALYQRLRRAKALEHPARAALHAACAAREETGTAGELARATGLERKTAEYHLGYLARLGLLRAIEGPPRRYATHAAASAGAPEPLDARLLAALDARPGLSAPALAAHLGETRARIDRRAKALVVEGALEARREKGARRFYHRSDASPSTERSAAR